MSYETYEKGSLRLVTPPTEEPVTIEEIMYEIRDAPDEDIPYLRSLELAARKYVETQLKRQIVTATWDYRLDCFPTWEIEMPLPPLQSITSIGYVDIGGASQVLDPANYVADIYSEPGRLTPAYNTYWPPARYYYNAVTIRFVAGYGQADAVPETIKQAIRMRVRMMYEGCPPEEFNRVTDSILSSEVWGCYA